MFQFVGFTLELGHKLLVLQRTQVDAYIHQCAQHSRTGRHHGHTSIRNGIAVAQASYIHDNRHQLIRIACHLHGNKGGKLGSRLDGSTARRLFLIRSFRHLEAGKHLVVGFRVAVYIFYKSPLLLQGNSGDMAHQLFVKFITFLTDGEVSNHSGKSRSNSTVQSGNTTATGDGIATRHFIQKFLYCQIN